MHREQLGGLNCVLSDLVGDAPPEAVAVFCHGFGAPGTDLVPLAGALADRLGDVADRVQFVFPAAPLSLEDMGMPGGRAWWPIDMLQLQMAMATGDFRDLRNETPELLPEMSVRLTALMSEILAQTRLPESRLIVGGFSQGAMLATDAALRLEERPGGLVVWSGTLLSEAAWSEAAARGSSLRVIQSHAVDDPILPYAGAEALRELLSTHGHQVEFLRFRGGHTIPESAISGAARLLEAVAAGSVE